MPAYTRLDVDERRRRLLAVGADIFTRHAYDEVSMAGIAREAGISKALLYHYFPSKRDFFVTTLQEKAAELAARTAAVADVEAGLDAFLAWVEENAEAYAKLMRSAGIPEVAEVVDAVREATAERIAAELGGDERARGAARAWLWFLDGAIVGWLAHGELTRADVRSLALRALVATAPGRA